jgi:hypothetical protein
MYDFFSFRFLTTEAMLPLLLCTARHWLTVNRRCGGTRLIAVFFMLASCLAYSATLKMEVTCSSEKPDDFQDATQRYIPEDGSLHKHRSESLE